MQRIFNSFRIDYSGGINTFKWQRDTGRIDLCHSQFYVFIIRHSDFYHIRKCRIYEYINDALVIFH